jgi:hypothetical protein
MDRMEVEIGGTCDTYDQNSNREPLEYVKRSALERLVPSSLTETPNFLFIPVHLLKDEVFPTFLPIAICITIQSGISLY